MNPDDKDEIDRYRKSRFPSFFGLFDEIFEAMDQEMRETMKKFFNEAPENMVREYKKPDGSIARQFGPFIYGYSMRVGPDGKPEIQEFGNVKPGMKPEGYGFLPRRQAEVADAREPLIETNDLGKKIQIIAEIPGVDKEDIKLRASDRTVVIDVDTPERKYHKQIDLPVRIDPKTAKSSYKNGVLDITINKKEIGEVGEEIKVT